ncbi:MAG: sugar phosphate isomerase/epimerase [Candidatus Nealsonbacteria bacterium]|nr:sugar phosphate isomerase/epimerase [Candidatus Nealsonbacteria bacterium]
MKLGFVSAILPDLSLKEIAYFAAAEKFRCVELMCWPKGKAERRYAGVTHVDVDGFDQPAADHVNRLMQEAGVEISGLGYYPNPLAPDAEESSVAVEHLKKVIQAASLLGVGVVNTFVGRDWTASVEDNWPLLMEVWPPLVQFAEDHGVRIGIENCPMLFGDDEWPGGKNLATCPAIWRRMFDEIPSQSFGLNYDPSHLVWQQIDYVKPLYEFADRIVHVHAKDAKVLRDGLDEFGVLAAPLKWHAPKLPGLGDVCWGKFISALTDIGYRGPVCIEVEDRAFESDLSRRKLSLRQSRDYLAQYCGAVEDA